MKKKKFETIKLHFIQNGYSIKNLLVTIILRVKIKNDYYIGPLITNDIGIIEVTQDELETEINKIQADFIMDYAASIHDCLNIEIKIEDILDLEKKVKNLKNWDSDKAYELQEKIKNSVNSQYEKLHMNLGLEFQKPIYINVKKLKLK